MTPWRAAGYGAGMKVKFLHARLFLEGIEVPLVSAVWNGSVGQPASASIQIPFSDVALRIKPRTTAFLFYKMEEGDDYLGAALEVVAVGVAKTPASRSVVLQCQDHTSYWDTTYLFNVTGLKQAGKRLAYFVGAKVYESDSYSSIFPEGGSSSAYSKLVKVLNRRPKSFPRMKGLLGGVVSLLEMVGGFYHGKTVFRGLNDFTSMAELRLKLMQQLLVSEDDNTAQMLLKKSGIKKWAKSVIGRRGSMVSFSQLLQQLFQFVFYQRSPVFAPPYFNPNKIVHEKTHRRYKKLNVPDRVVEEFMRWLYSARSQAEELESMITTGLVDTDYTPIGQSTEIYDAEKQVQIIGKRLRPDYKTKWIHLNRAAEKLAQIWFPYENKFCQIYPLVRQIKNVYLERLSPGRVLKNKSAKAQITAVQNKLDIIERRVRGCTGNRLVKKWKTRWTEEIPDRLGTTVIAPELLFSPPPRCNVIFPDFYTNLDYQRNFLGEPTRLMLRAGEVRKNDIFSGGYSKMKIFFAPDTETVRGAVKMGTKEFAKSVMPHEVHTGIVPSQQQIPWAGAYRLKVKGRTEYVQRLANYLYLKQRYGQRNATVNGVFMPQLLIGFPVLIIDKLVENPEVFDQWAELADADIEKQQEFLTANVPEQYLGVIQSIAHTLKYDVLGTSVGVSYLRTHREQLDSLGDKKVKYKVRVGSKQVTEVTTYNIKLLIDGRFPKAQHPRLIMKWYGDALESFRRLGPGYVGFEGDIISYRQSRAKTNLGVWTRRAAEWLSDGVSTELSAHVSTEPYFKSAGRFLPGKLEQEQALMGSAIYEVILRPTYRLVRRGIYQVRERSLSFEELVTPPWLSKIWQFPKIDKTIKSLFGVTTIMDELITSVDYDEDGYDPAWYANEDER